MSNFLNPFTPFINSHLDYSLDRVVFHDAYTHNVIGSAQTLGDYTYLRDQIGNNVGSIQHFTNDTSYLHDAHGQDRKSVV